MLLRSLSAVSQRLASKPIVAVLLADSFVLGRAMYGVKRWELISLHAERAQAADAEVSTGV